MALGNGNAGLDRILLSPTMLRLRPCPESLSLEDSPPYNELLFSGGIHGPRGKLSASIGNPSALDDLKVSSSTTGPASIALGNPCRDIAIARLTLSNRFQNLFA
jgi:hypothetical protein